FAAWLDRRDRRALHRRGARTRDRILVAALELGQPLLYRAVAALHLLHFLLELGVDALELGSLAGQLGPVLRHADFHLAHLLHHRVFVFLQLLAQPVHFLAFLDELGALLVDFIRFLGQLVILRDEAGGFELFFPLRTLF